MGRRKRGAGLLSRSRARLAGWRLERLAAKGRAPIVYGNRVGVLPGGFEAYAELEAAIAAARSGIAIEMYTWADDRLGRRLADAVAARARDGIRVLVLLDSFGSLGSAALAARLESAGVTVLWYHALVPWARRFSWNRRNHRKLVLIDGSVGLTGGINIAESFTREFSGDAAWRDVAVVIRGPAVRELARLFIASWIAAGGDVADTSAAIGEPREAGTAGIQVFGGRRLTARRRLRSTHLAQIALARSSIVIANAYFAPEHGLLRALCHAARRGVRVELLLPGKSDAAPVRWAARAAYGALLEAGVVVRELHRAVLHAKVAVFDGDTLLTGSANLDYRSFRHNLEVAVTIFERDAATAALAAIESETIHALRVDLAEWSRRPWTARLQERLALAIQFWL